MNADNTAVTAMSVPRHSRFRRTAAWFIGINRALSRHIEKLLPDSFTRHLHTLYKYEVARRIDCRVGPQTVLDIGAGKECPFRPFLSQPDVHVIIGLDCAEIELRANRDLRYKVVGDAAAIGFPFAEGSADVVASRSVVEHIHDNKAFIANCSRVLKPGGVLIHTFPGRFAPFAVVNRILPNWLSRRLLAAFHPAWKDECGFKAYYDCCYYSRIRELLTLNGFSDIEFSFRYYQSIYFDFFVPLYMVMLAYDLLVWASGICNLACGLMVGAELATSSEKVRSDGARS